MQVGGSTWFYLKHRGHDIKCCLKERFRLQNIQHAWNQCKSPAESIESNSRSIKQERKPLPNSNIALAWDFKGSSTYSRIVIYPMLSIYKYIYIFAPAKSNSLEFRTRTSNTRPLSRPTKTKSTRCMTFLCDTVAPQDWLNRANTGSYCLHPCVCVSKWAEHGWAKKPSKLSKDSNIAV